MLHETVVLDDVSRFTDRELIATLRRLIRTDQALTAQLLVHLGEVDARGLYREHAYPSMFAYCVEKLCMSEAQAYLRIQAARLSRQFPRILQLVAQGALNLSGIKLLGPHLTADNHLALLEEARGKGKREVELLVAAIAPKPDVPNRIRKLPEPSFPSIARSEAEGTLQAKVGLEPCVSSSALHADVTPPDVSQTPCDASPRSHDGTQTPHVLAARETNAARFVLETPRRRGSSTPLSPGRYKVEFTAGQALHDKLTQLKDLLRHQACSQNATLERHSFVPNGRNGGRRLRTRSRRYSTEGSPQCAATRLRTAAASAAAASIARTGLARWSRDDMQWALRCKAPVRPLP
jgi:hypothetical protein